MADSAVSALTAASALDGTELYYTVQGGADRKATGAQIKTLMLAGATTSLGAADAPAPVAQTLNVQSVSTGTADTAGVNWTISGSKSTGSAKGGSIVFKTSDTGAASTTQNGYVTALTIGAADPAIGNQIPVAFGSGVVLSIGNFSVLQNGEVWQNTVSNASWRMGETLSGQLGFFSTSVTTEAFGFLSGNYNNAADTVFTRNAAAVMQMGFKDAAAPVAQTLTVQSVVAGTSNTAGADFTIAGSKGTGTGAGGSLVFKTAPAGGAGSSQNALATHSTMAADGAWDITGATLGAFQIRNAGTVLFHASTSNSVETVWLRPRLDATYDLGSTPTGGFDGGWANLFLSTAAKIAFNNDTYISRPAAATLQQGAADAAAPVAQTLTVQSVVAGTSNTAGADFTIAGSKGTGTGAGGSLVFKTAPAGGSGSSQNALSATLKLAENFVGMNFPANSTGYQSWGFESAAGTFKLRRWADNWAVASSSVFVVDNSITTDTFSIQAGSFNLYATTNLWMNNNVMLSSPAAGTLQQGDADAASPVARTLTVQSVVAGTTDTAGTVWTRLASKGTGTAAGGNIVDKTAFSAKSTGSGQGTAVDRKVIVAKGKVLTDATPVSLFEIALPTLTMCGGQIEATVVCTNGTDMQSFTQTISYSAVNKGGVYTKSITASTGDKSVSAGTIVNTWTLLDGTNKVTVQLSSDTSLTPSTNAFMVYYSVKNNSEQATTIL